MKDDSQVSKIALALRKGHTLTMLDCFRLCGTLNAHKRLDELEQRGFKLHKGWKYHKGRRLRTWREA